MTSLLNRNRWLRLLVIMALWGAALGIIGWSMAEPEYSFAQADDLSLTGTLQDAQNQGICEVDIQLFINGQPEPTAETITHCDGSFILTIPAGTMIDRAEIHADRPHFEAITIPVDDDAIADLNDGESTTLAPQLMERAVTAGFWVAAGTFVIVLLLIALDKLHNMLAALLGVSVVMIASALGPPLGLKTFIFSFESALHYVNFEVIFLIMGMMIVIAAIEGTGIFQWVTFQAYRLSGGRVWLLVIILMAITSVASALLDNVTTMLLMAPLTIQIAISLDINPLSLLLPEVMASNVGGISTLIGTPTNILIGSYAGLGFNDFLVNLTPGVLLALAALMGYSIVYYRKQWKSTGGTISETLYNRMEESGKITEPEKLKRAGIIFGIMIFGFVLGEKVHIVPAVVAISGAVLILLFVERDVETMLQLVDWTTLIFFISLFILVGAVQEVGVLSIIAMAISGIVGDSVMVAILVLVWSAALLSGIIANIPFTAAMLPVVQFLSRTIPGATSNVLFYALSVGSAMGGNSSLIGASANMVTAGISERAGYRITYMDFVKVGLPATIITVAVGCGWLLIRFL